MSIGNVTNRSRHSTYFNHKCPSVCSHASLATVTNECCDITYTLRVNVTNCYYGFVFGIYFVVVFVVCRIVVRQSVHSLIVDICLRTFFKTFYWRPLQIFVHDFLLSFLCQFPFPFLSPSPSRHAPSWLGHYLYTVLQLHSDRSTVCHHWQMSHHMFGCLHLFLLRSPPLSTAILWYFPIQKQK